MAIRGLKGMPDRFEADLAAWRQIERTAEKVFINHGFGEVRTPILEPAELFLRGVGEETDIVGKEMYLFNDKDKAQTLVCLRPENTASVVRAMIASGALNGGQSAKAYYCGPMFRRERPQKGRYRQFHQIGAEAFGSERPESDVEMLSMIWSWLSELGIRDMRLELNTLGSRTERAEYRDRLKEYFESVSEHLCMDCQRRVDTNALRILDCKNPTCREYASAAPTIFDSLTEASRVHFESVKSGLDDLKIPFVVDPHLVRGIDYYTHTVFEFKIDAGLGAQNTIAAGGRYDALVEELGGPSTPGIGFAAGLERLSLVLEAQGIANHARCPIFYLVAADASGLQAVTRLTAELRRAGLYVERDLKGRSVKAQMKQANKLSAQYALVLGEDEVESGVASVRVLADGALIEVKLTLESLLALTEEG